MAIVYQRRTLFTLMLAKNMARLGDEERKEALQQFDPEVQSQVEKVITLTRRHKDGPNKS